MNTYTAANAIDAPEGYYWFKRGDKPWHVVSVERTEGFCISIAINDTDFITFYADGEAAGVRHVFTLHGPLVPPT